MTLWFISMKKLSTKRIVFIALGVAIAMIFSYIENVIVVPIPVPGIRIGLANIVSVFFLYYMGTNEAVLVGFIRIVLSSLLFGSMFSFIFSITGFVLSILSMILLRKTNRFSIVGVSMAGGLLHNVGQILIAMIATHFIGVIQYLPLMAFTGTIAGIINGFLAFILLERVKSYDRIFER